MLVVVYDPNLSVYQNLFGPPSKHVLIHVHIKVDLGAQVQVEEGINTEHKEQNGCHDQECILKKIK